MKKLALALVMLAITLSSSFAQVTLTFWHSMGDYAKLPLDQLVAEFNRTHPGIEVRATFQGTYDETVTKMKTALLVGAGPDLAMVNIEHIQIFTQDNSLMQLDNFLAADPELSPEDFVEQFWHAIIREGSAYAIPFNISALVLYYNRDLFRQAGLDPDRPPATWDEMEEMARALTVVDARRGRTLQYGLLWAVDHMFYQFEPLVWQSGGDIFTEDMSQCLLDSEIGKETLKRWASWFDEGLSPRDLTVDEGVQSFMMGRVAMGAMTSGGIRYGLENLPWDLGVAVLPMNKEKATTLGGGSLAIMNHVSEEKREAAWTFIRWMVQEKNTLMWYERTGYMPVKKSALDSLEIQLIWRRFPQLKAPIDSIPYARPRPVHENIIEIRNILFNTVERVRQGVEDPETAFLSAVPRVNELLK